MLHFVIMIGFMLSLGFTYVLVVLYQKFISKKGRREKDRAIMEALGRKEMQYNNSYYGKISNPSRIGENLPTESCKECGAALNPDDIFCSKCGKEVWGREKGDTNQYI